MTRLEPRIFRYGLLGTGGMLLASLFLGMAPLGAQADPPQAPPSKAKPVGKKRPPGVPYKPPPSSPPQAQKPPAPAQTGRSNPPASPPHANKPASGPPAGQAVPHAARTEPPQARPVPGPAPQGDKRPYDARSAPPPPRSYPPSDHRYSRPPPEHVRPAPGAPPPPPARYYRPYYTHWYVHPYYRSLSVTWVVVDFGFAVAPWTVTWAPPVRPGWAWVSGYWDVLGFWVPGHWAPMAGPPVYAGVNYVYAPGWWQGSIYVEGYWRPSTRSGWDWVEGYYLADGTYIPGYWQPTTGAPAGYTWEPGMFDGKSWVEGFWRPAARQGYSWVSSYFDGDGVFHAGYWQPMEQKPGFTWVPGWFDGDKWVEGYWITETDYKAADPQKWTPPEGWNEGQSSDGQQAPDQGAQGGSSTTSDDGAPLAIPVDGGAQ